MLFVQLMSFSGTWLASMHLLPLLMPLDMVLDLVEPLPHLLQRLHAACCMGMYVRSGPKTPQGTSRATLYPRAVLLFLFF